MPRFRPIDAAATPCQHCGLCVEGDQARGGPRAMSPRLWARLGDAYYAPQKESAMKVRNVFAAAMLSGALFAVPAFAQGPQGGFSALEGVDAQALSVEEMEAISGELNAYDIAAALLR